MTPREIYIEALEKIGEFRFSNHVVTEEELSKRLRFYSDGVRQSRESRIARKALKDATYARMFDNGS